MTAKQIDQRPHNSLKNAHPHHKHHQRWAGVRILLFHCSSSPTRCCLIFEGVLAAENGGDGAVGTQDFLRRSPDGGLAQPRPLHQREVAPVRPLPDRLHEDLPPALKRAKPLQDNAEVLEQRPLVAHNFSGQEPPLLPQACHLLQLQLAQAEGQRRHPPQGVHAKLLVVAAPLRSEGVQRAPRQPPEPAAFPRRGGNHHLFRRGTIATSSTTTSTSSTAAIEP
mmetsp:Transcript_423/g.946  ORF Transcript_423/g.946 Transcript_423/m.946 type:complete len:223 (-) Transcript_423:191-859(-)